MQEDNLDNPVTKRDLQREMEQLRGEMDQLRVEMNQGYKDLAEKLTEKLTERFTDGETRLLKAFYAYGQTGSKRMTGMEVDHDAIRGRIAVIEDRLMEVERRLDIPPLS